MKLSVIIPCYNAAGSIACQLEALANQSWSEPWEVIVSNNGSTDGTLDIVNSYRSRVPALRIVDSSDRQGAAHARNVGALHAAGELLAFCDADDEVAPGWVAAMGEALAKHDFVAGRLDPEKLNPPWVLNSRMRIQHDGLRAVTYPPYLLHAASANLGVRRTLHEAVEGFDESLPCLEDTDYCFRIQLKGTALNFAPEALVNYRYRQTLRDIYRQSRDFARFRILLSKRYKSIGESPPRPWATYLKEWKKLLRGTFRIRSKENLGRWIRILGKQVGRTWGCIEFRSPPV